MILELSLLLPCPDREEAKCSRQKTSARPCNRVIDRTDTESNVAAAGRQIAVSNRSVPEQQVEQLEDYVNCQGRHYSEVVR